MNITNIKNILSSTSIRTRHFLYILCNTLHYLCTPPGSKNILVNAFLDLYCGHFRHQNFGDDLNYYLIKEISGKNIVCYNNLLFRFIGISRKNLSCIGSTVELLTNKSTTIWGTGAIYGNIPIKTKPHKVLAVRGPLTREYLIKNGIDCPDIYGDPALLLPLLYTSKRSKKYKIGVIPHYTDKKNKVINEFVENGKGKVKLINLVDYGQCLDIIEQITSCEFIISSSLHGLIVSDAYGVPNVWAEFSDNIWGNGFKYRDYYASINMNDVYPVIIKDFNGFEQAMKFKEKWKPIKIDLTKLIESCPFDFKGKLKDNYHPSH